MNWVIIFIITLIAGIGFVALLSAANNIDPWAKKQIIRYCIGLMILITVASIDLRIWLTLSYPCYFISLLLLIAVEITGKIGMGAQRWINLYFFPLQPSELMKVTLIMALARYFHAILPRSLSYNRSLIPPLLMIFLPVLLVLRQPDLGTAILLGGAGLAICFIAGINSWKILAIVISIITSIPILWNFLHEYQKHRVLAFLNPELDPLGIGYHILQSKIALSSGGIFGKGFGKGSQSHLDFLPEKQTDFIFAMFCEEFGIVGGLILLSLYAVLLFYSFYIALKSHTSYGRLLGVGIATLFFLCVSVNIGMVMGLLPVVGIPLPLVSYGGTALLTVMIAFGLIIAIDLNRKQKLRLNT